MSDVPDFPDFSAYLPPEGKATEPSLLARIVAGLQGYGRLVATSWETDTFEVLPSDAAADEHAADGTSLLEPTVGVVLPYAQRVVFYTVWPDAVPAERIPAISELAHRVNTDLYTSALEFNIDSGILAVRSGFEYDLLPALDRETENALAWNALLEVEAVYLEYTPVVQAVLAGSTALDALATLQA